jgi:Fe-S-cluster containining protein
MEQTMTDHLLTPHQKIVATIEKHPWMEQNKLFRLADRLATEKSRFELRRLKLLNLANQFNAAIREFTPCKSGCAYCCSDITMIYEHEAKLMSAASGKPYQRILKRSEVEAISLAEIYAGQPCQFLSDNQCSIYNSRPLICRLHHSLADTSEPCRLHEAITMCDPDDIEVPYMGLVEDAKPNERWGAIQDFFPV